MNIAPNAPYNDYWGYQENLLPKYQKILGNDVTVIVPNLKHQDGKIVLTSESDYILDDGVRVIRMAYKDYHERHVTNIMSYIPVYDLLCEIKPDFIFYHGLLSITIKDVVKYKKQHSKCIVVQDNHLDYNIGFRTDSIKEKLFRLWYRNINRFSIRYVEKVYGVTPWRKTYAEDYFNIPTCKTDVLIMGADDEKIKFEERDSIRQEIRRKYGIATNEFLVVTGGKIDKNKGIDILAEACSLLVDKHVKLLIFGQMLDDVKDKLTSIIEKTTNIIYIGWIGADAVYDYFFAADLVMFPGQHSVLWEQACASKVPCVFKKWEGMDHVNVNGNSDFMDEVTVVEVQEKIKELLFTKKYFDIKMAADSEVTDIYLYSKIAEKSLECMVDTNLC